MRIAIVTELFLPNIGGQEVRYAEIAKALTSRGHSVEVYCIRNSAATREEEIADGIAIHRGPTAYGYQKPLLKVLRRSPSAVLQFALACRKIPSSHYDFVIFNQWPLAHVLLAPKAIRTKAAVDWCEYRGGAFFSLLQKYLPRLVSRNITNSIALKQAFEARSGRKFEVVPSGIFRSPYQSAPAAQRSGLVYLGRIEEHKNLPLMVAAYQWLRNKGYQGRLRIAGSGPGSAKLEGMVASSGLLDYVDLMGLVSEQQKIELLASSEILLLTSRREGFPRVIAEAMASGLPVVTVDYPGNGAAAIVQQYGIGKVTEPNPARIAEGVLAALAMWEEFSRACIKASNFMDWDVLVDQLLRVASVKQVDYA